MARGKSGRHIFQVREPDVYQSLQGFYGLHTLVAAGVVHHRDGETPVFCHTQGRDQERDEMLRCHQIDIVSPLLLQIQKDLCHPLRRDLCETGRKTVRSRRCARRGRKLPGAVGKKAALRGRRP